jgi:hypothetical protein
MELMDRPRVQTSLPLMCEGLPCTAVADWRCIVACPHGHDTVIVMCTRHRDESMAGTATCVTHDCAVQIVAFERLRKE